MSRDLSDRIKYCKADILLETIGASGDDLASAHATSDQKSESHKNKYVELVSPELSENRIVWIWFFVGVWEV